MAMRIQAVKMLLLCFVAATPVCSAVRLRKNTTAAQLNATGNAGYALWSFAMGTGNRLVGIKQTATGSKSTELHRLTAASNYGAFDLHTGTGLHETDDSWAFAMDSGNNLVAIKKQATGAGKTEVHRLSAGSGYQSFDLQTGTGLHETDNTWAFLMDSSNNLICIKKSGGAGKTEVHRLTASSNYADFDLQTPTGLEETDEKFAFVMDSNNNLVAIKKRDTGSKSTEVHRLTASSDYKDFDLHAGTPLHETDSTFSFVMDSGNNLLAIKKAHCGSAKTEVHRLSGGSNYQSWTLHAATGLEETYPDPYL